MKTYDLIEKELKEYYIAAQKWCFIISSVILLLFVVLAFFYTFAQALLFVCVPISLTFYITYLTGRQRYGKTLRLSDGIVSIYDYKNNLVDEYRLDETSCCYLNVAFDHGRPIRIYKRCLIFYKNIELYENMEYSTYWNDSELVIIQNPQLIEVIEKLINV